MLISMLLACENQSGLVFDKYSGLQILVGAILGGVAFLVCVYFVNRSVDKKTEARNP
jgi:hypothetical protein